MTNEMRQMNAYWRLLVGLIHEGLGVINDERSSPESRLEQLHKKLEFAQCYVQILPSSVRAELDADQAVQAALADLAERRDDIYDEGGMTLLMLGDDGTFHPTVDCQAGDLRPLSDQDLQALF